MSAFRLPLRFVPLSLILVAPSLWGQSTGAAPVASPSPAIPSLSTAAPAKPPKSKKPSAPNPAAGSLRTYIERVRADSAQDRPADGSIWTPDGRFTRIATDMHAMRKNDLISVVVSESLAASTDGTVKNSRASNASTQITGLIGALHQGNALQNLVNQSSASGLNAAGASATNSSLSTTFGGQVVDVLPNGTLVIEAARQVEFSQQTQTIVLRGLVRPEDISQQNQILSTAISSLELEVRGKGIVNDYTYRQNPLVRWLEKVLVF
jgi:flagellar L-ring protein precursor FlgH